MNLPTTPTLDLEQDGGWLTVWFNQPEIRNPLTAERSADLAALDPRLGAGGREVGDVVAGDRDRRCGQARDDQGARSRHVWVRVLRV